MIKKLLRLYSPPVPAPHSWKDHGILPALATVFFDYTSIVLAGVVFAPIIIGGAVTSSGGDVLRFFDFSVESRTLIFCLAIAIYPFLQFFLAPVIGSMSDRFGRKPVLVVSCIGLCVSAFMTAIGVYCGYFSEAGIYIILLSRVFTGLFSGNIGVTQSALTDYAKTKQMQGNIGLTFVSFGMMAATGSILGALIGGFIPVYFNFYTTFLILGCLNLLNALWLSFFFKETISEESRREKASVNPFMGVKYIKTAYLHMGRPLTYIFTMYIFYRIGWQFFVNFSQLYIVREWNPSHAETYIGFLWIVGMICYSLLQYFVNQPLNKLGHGKDKVMRLTLFIEGGFLLASSFVGQLVPTFIILGVIGIAANSFNSSNSAAAVGALAPADKKGYVLGCAQSFQAMAQFITAIVAGFAANLYIPLPIILSGACILMAGFILNATYKRIHAK